MPEKALAFRPTAKQLQVLEQWIANHQEQGGETLTTSDALRAAIEALEVMEKRRAQQRDRNRRWRASEAIMREIVKRRHGETTDASDDV